MPKRTAGPISHSALTNHRIPATAGQLVRAGAPPMELIHINQPPGGVALPRVTLLKAYGELMDREPRFRQRYLELLDVLESATPDDAFVQAALGRKSLQDPSPKAASRAREQLARAIELGFRANTVYADLSDALERLGRLEESARVLADGVALNPYAPVLYKMLAMRYIGLKQYPQAKEIMQRYVEIFPEDAFMRGLLEKATKQN
jgi:tetratricopeptide (TPR) repeat protein